MYVCMYMCECFRQPEFCGWAFNLERGLPCQEKWDLIPEEGVDILITHGPPLGHGDLCCHGNRAGCLQLLHTVQRIQPKYHVFGHIHEGKSRDKGHVIMST